MNTYRVNSKPKHSTIHTRWQTRVKVCRAISWKGLSLPRKRYVPMFKQEVNTVKITPCKVNDFHIAWTYSRPTYHFMTCYTTYIIYGKVRF